MDIELSNGVTTIGDDAFLYCNKLTSITIPESVTQIGTSVSGSCETVTLKSNSLVSAYRSSSKSMKSIFGEQVRSYIIGETVKDIGGYAFYGCSQMTSVIIPESVKSIGESAFWGCKGLTSLEAGNGVTSIGGYAFQMCTKLTKIILHNKVASIGGGAFSYCRAIKDVFCLSEEVPTAYGGSFEQAVIALACLHVPGKSLEAYKETLPWSNFGRFMPADYSFSFEGIYYTFSENDAEVSLAGDISSNVVVIPESVTYNGQVYNVTSIGDEAFLNCSNLKSISIPRSITTIGERAFEGCNNLTSVTLESNAIVSESRTTSSSIKSIFGAQVTKYIIGNCVEDIGNNAFNGCSQLSTIVVGSGVISVGENAFNGCNNLISVTLQSDALLSEPRTEVSSMKSTFGSQVKKYVIGDDVHNIGAYSFYGCSSMTSVTIPNSVTNIGESAFSGCIGLTSVTIPQNVACIGNSAFFNCHNLNSIKVDTRNVTYDSRNNCNAIIETATNTLITGCLNTTIPDDLVAINDYAFYNCSGLTNITIPESVTSIGSSAFYGCTNITSLSLNCENIGAWFNGNKSLEVLTLGNNVKCIGEWAFDHCSGLTSVTIPKSVTNIGKGAFAYCSGLTSITVPNNVTTIMDSTFCCCSNLSEISIPNSVTSIGNNAFSYCYCLPEISIPNSVTSIGNNAFYYCWRLKTITIPNSVTFIGEFAFYSCLVLVDVYCLPENVPETSNTAFGSSSVASATLHVPAASIEAYKVTEPWSEFGSFVALTEDEIVGIKEIEKEQRTKDNKDCEFYDIQGRKATELRRGLNIIRYFDGTRRKVLLK